VDRLWSPWRYGYVTGERPTGCVFCALLSEPDGLGNLVVRRERHAALVLNRYPYNSGHVMVIPLRHTVELSELTADESAGTWGLVARTADLLRAGLGADAVNVGVNLGRAAGGSVDHVHVHLVPRWQGDTNFMPVLADAKVLVELLPETFARFESALRAWDDVTE
jgi:ATP adenylyltransferase